MTSIGTYANRTKPATEYANARKNFLDYTAKWITERF
jgi:hypothetical protein